MGTHIEKACKGERCFHCGKPATTVLIDREESLSVSPNARNTQRSKKTTLIAPFEE